MTTARTLLASLTAVAGTAAAGTLTALASAPVAYAADESGALVGDRGIVVASDRFVNVRAPGRQRDVVVREGARVAYAAGGRVVFEQSGRVTARDLESTYRLTPGPGVESQKLLGAGAVGQAAVAVVEEERAPQDRDDAGAYRSNLVAVEVDTDERTVLRRGFSSFEGGYTNAHVFDDGSVIAAAFQSAAVSFERYATEGSLLWTKRVASDAVAELAVIGNRVNVVRSRSRGGDTVLRIVRLDPDTGERRGARSVRLPGATAAPFCQDWRTRQRLLCQTSSGAVVIDTIGADAGIVNRIKAPSGAFVSVIGGR